MIREEKQAIIGVDISKDKLDIYDLTSKKHWIIKNHARAIADFLSSINSLSIEAKIVFEPTGGYEQKLIDGLLARKMQGYYIHPNKLYNFKKCHGEKAKTDKIDAIFIAEFANTHPAQLKEISVNYAANKRLLELKRAREQIKSQLYAAKCFMEHERYDKSVKQHYKRLNKFLAQELRKIEQGIDEAINSNEQKRQIVERLMEIEGVGKVTAQTMACNVPELGQLGRNKISKLIGVAPVNQDSGKKQGPRHIQGGRADVRAVLYMAALSAIKFNDRMKEVYRHLREGGKPFKVAIVAIMRRLVCVMNAMIRDNTNWQHNKELVTQKA
jgi:transposase